MSYELLKSQFTWYIWIVIFLYSYLLLYTSYHIWKRAIEENRPPVAQKWRRYGYMYIFALLLFFANIYSLGGFA